MSIPILLQELADSQQTNDHLTTTVSSLRLSVTQSQSRLNNTTSALKIAANNAANARCDADAAHARVQTLIDQVGVLKRSIEECRRTTKTVCEEHERISTASRDLGSQLMKCEAELQHAQNSVEKLKRSHSKIENQNKTYEIDNQRLQAKLDAAMNKLSRCKDNLQQQSELDTQRIERSQSLESSLRHHKSLLVEATHSAAEQESASASLSDAIVQLKAENVRVHANMQQIRTDTREEREELSAKIQNLTKANQILTVKNEDMAETISAKHLKCEGMEKQVQQLKARIQTLEKRRIKERDQSSKLGDISIDINMGNNSTVTPISYNTPSSSGPRMSRGKLPSLSKTPLSNNFEKRLDEVANRKKTKSKENNSNCAICNETPYGLMKTCQCGRNECKLRAHIGCITRRNKALGYSDGDNEAYAKCGILCEG